MTIVACPLEHVDAGFRRYAPARVIGLLSPGMTPPALPIADDRRLQLAFNDIAAPRDGLVAPGDEHIAALLAFAEGWDRAAPLLVHCWAGVSRSTAVAYVLACLRDGPGKERRLAATLRAKAPFATPNPLIVSLADQAMAREGRMTAAIAAIGRGADAVLGTTFSL